MTLETSRDDEALTINYSVVWTDYSSPVLLTIPSADAVRLVDSIPASQLRRDLQNALLPIAHFFDTDP